jgi:hypothetical protein
MAFLLGSELNQDYQIRAACENLLRKMQNFYLLGVKLLCIRTAFVGIGYSNRVLWIKLWIKNLKTVLKIL